MTMLKKNSVIRTRTPMRVTLCGGGTDVHWYSSKYGGAWISAALTRYVTVFLKPNTISLNKNVNQNKIVCACLIKSGVSYFPNISWISDVPEKSGLGGSGAFEVGLLHALELMTKNRVSKLQIAQKAADIEMRILHMDVGPQDQYITSLGGVRYFEIDRNGTIYQEPLKVKATCINLLQKNLLYFSTGIVHDTARITLKVKQLSQGTSKQIVQVLHDIKALGLEAKKFLLSSRIDDFGETFDAHWKLKRQLSRDISLQNIDMWYDEGRKSGALGGKIIGAGGGGWFVFYVPKAHKKFIERMEKIGLTHEQVLFDWNGTMRIT